MALVHQTDGLQREPKTLNIYVSEPIGIRWKQTFLRNNINFGIPYHLECIGSFHQTVCTFINNEGKFVNSVLNGTYNDLLATPENKFYETFCVPTFRRNL